MSEKDAKPITPTPGKKRGRKLKILETGAEISHEEVVLGLIKRTAVTLANAGQCACGTPLMKPKRGRAPVRCDVCEVERRKGYARSRKGAKKEHRKPDKTLYQTLKRADNIRDNRRTWARKAREEREAAGLCLRCGKTKTVGTCADCKERIRVAARKRRQKRTDQT